MDQGDDVVQHGLQVEFDALDFEFAGFDFGEVQDVVDDAQQVLAGGLDFAQVIELLRAEFGFEHQVGHAQHRVHGGADFVAHVGQKVGFGAVGGFGRFFGLGQFGRACKHHFFELFAVAFALLFELYRGGHITR